MRLETLDIERAIGGVLVHNIADAQGHKALSKGQRLNADDVARLRALGKTNVLVAIFEAGDVGENDAATRIANAVCGENISRSTASGGRINLFAAVRGIVKVDTRALMQLNALDGLAIATIASNQVVAPQKMVATIKTIGLAMQESILRRVDEIKLHSLNIISILALRAARVALILTGSPEARARVEKTFTPALQARVQELGASIISNEFTAHDERAIANAIGRAKSLNVDCVILAGETSIMDLGDVTPRGILQAGGKIEAYGAPVEPGNLLLLAYADDLPIVGAPGCVKSRDTNVVDLILPRLLAGERVTKQDVIALANGGLLL